mgnify:CR=1 FL=1
MPVDVDRMFARPEVDFFNAHVCVGRESKPLRQMHRLGTRARYGLLQRPGWLKNIRLGPYALVR